MIATLTPELTPSDISSAEPEGVTGATELPIVLLSEQVAFPRISQPLQLTDAASLWALERLQDDAGVLLLQTVGEGDAAHHYSVGTVCTLVRRYLIPSGGYSALFKGQERVQVLATERDGDGYVAMVSPLAEQTRSGPELEALRRTLSTQIHEYAEKSNRVAPEVVALARRITHAGYLADLAAAKLVEDPERQQELLEELDVYERMFAVTALLSGWIRTLDVRSSIQGQIQEGIESAQRNFYLKEQLRTIQRELGIANAVGDEREELLEAIAGSQMPDDVRARATKEIERLEGISPASPELAVVRNYIDTLMDLPWKPERPHRRRVGLQSSRRVLDRHHFGLEKVKNRVIEYLAVRSLTDESQSPILCLVGPPGVGKTSLGRAIAQAVRRRYIRVSLGGVRDEAEIRGHRRTYVGAMPGRIIQGMARAGTVDPVFVLDEVDKIGRDFRGDPSSALLEALDPEHNRNFSDHYLEVGYDLSQVLFLLTANNEWGIPPTLRDRLEIIRLEGYTAREKLAIAKGHLIPRQLKDHGLTTGGKIRLRISDGALDAIVQSYTREAGVRELERRIAAVCRKVARRRAGGEPAPRVVRADGLRDLLGPAPYTDRIGDTRDRVGVVNGLAVTDHGGELLPVEAAWSRGQRKFVCTGNLGEVMTESAQAALSYVTQHAGKLGFQPNALSNAFVHLHVPEGAVPKDGPSAGIAMGTALASAFLGRSVRGDLAMTGEVTIQGRVLPIGGVKEKVLAAQRHGIREVILPAENRSEVGEIPADVRRNFKFTFVDSMDQVLAAALRPAP